MESTFKSVIKNLLFTLPVCIENSTKTQYTVRCPYCGDSINPLHGHFSIKIDENSFDPILYRCFKCPASGILTPQVLEDLRLYISQDLSNILKAYNRKLVKQNKYINTNNAPYNAVIHTNTALNNKKIEYINKRLGLNIDNESAPRYKIILDLFEFISGNKINTIPNVSYNYLRFLNSNYVGFLSTNNNSITLRRIDDTKNIDRYRKVIINNLNINNNSFYSIPNSIDLLYTQDINIHISEGVFDILSIFHNVNEARKENNFYFAACGFGYISIIRYLIYNGINTGINLFIYSDNDKTEKDHYKYLFKNTSFHIWLDHITIVKNTYENEKDFGVVPSKINPYYKNIK